MINKAKNKRNTIEWASYSSKSQPIFGRFRISKSGHARRVPELNMGTYCGHDQIRNYKWAGSKSGISYKSKLNVINSYSNH